MLKYAKEARSNGVLHVQIFALTANILTYTDYRRVTCPNVLHKRTMFVPTPWEYEDYNQCATRRIRRDEVYAATS